jgi:hypothetical protein
MREERFLVRTPMARYFLIDHCANCLTSLSWEVEGLFCSTWCREIATFVRYKRSVTRDGRITLPDVRYAVMIQVAHLLNGGYGSLGRTLSPATRRAVKERDRGLCRVCGKQGTEVDHIDGSSPDLDNLQLLCPDCHQAKTSEHLAPAPQADRTLILAFELSRVLPDEPRLLADDEHEWNLAWRKLKSERRQRLVVLAEAVGVDITTVKKTAELVEAILDSGDDLGRVAEDDDSGYGPASYFARSLDRED